MEAEVKQVIKVVICFQISIFEPLKTTSRKEVGLAEEL